MAEIDIAGILVERIDEKFIRDCTNPTAAPMRKETRRAKVLQIAADCAQPDEVTVNGVAYLPTGAV